MPRLPTIGVKRQSFWQRLKEIDTFFEGRGKEHQTLRRLVRRLDRAKISYAIMGGMAVNAHQHERTTKDVDVLLTSEGWERFREHYLGKQYLPVAGRARRITEKQSGVTVDVLLAGHYPGTGKPGPIPFPDPAEVCDTINAVKVVNLATLIQLKLAARRYQDFADVVSLIRAHDLSENYANHLHPSVRRDFVECLEEKRRDDEYKEHEEIG